MGSRAARATLVVGLLGSTLAGGAIVIAAPALAQAEPASPASPSLASPSLARDLGKALDQADRAAFFAILSARVAAAPGQATHAAATAAATAAALAPWLGVDVASGVLLALPPDRRAAQAPAVLVAVLLAARGTEAERVAQAVRRAAPGVEAALVARIVRRVQAAAGDAEALRLLAFEDLETDTAEQTALTEGATAAGAGDSAVRSWLALPPDPMAVDSPPSSGLPQGLSGDDGMGWSLPPADPRPEQLLARPSPS